MSHTKIVKLDPDNPQEIHLKEAADILKKGGLVILPTETVYGIAANMLNKKTLERLYEIKKRPKDKLFSLHVAEKNKIEEFAAEIPPSAYRLIDKFWPGPLTLVLKSRDKGSVGMRMPDNRIALGVIALAGVPLVCPSANISGGPAPQSFSNAIKDLDGLVDFAIDAGDTRLGLESSVVDLSSGSLKILREGAVKKEDIESAVRKKIILFVCTGNSCRSVMAQAILQKILREQKRDDVEVLSAGTMTVSQGLGATEATKEILKKYGMDASRHRSQSVTRDMINKSDIILVMEKKHEENILGFAPEAKNRLFLLKEFARIEDDNLDIDDPIGATGHFYENTFFTIKEAVERVSKVI